MGHLMGPLRPLWPCLKSWAERISLVRHWWSMAEDRSIMGWVSPIDSTSSQPFSPSQTRRGAQGSQSCWALDFSLALAQNHRFARRTLDPPTRGDRLRGGFRRGFRFRRGPAPLRF